MDLIRQALVSARAVMRTCKRELLDSERGTAKERVLDKNIERLTLAIDVVDRAKK